jgi:hypothetical protein
MGSKKRRSAGRGGIKRLVFYMGNIVAYVLGYSDGLLKFLAGGKTAGGLSGAQNQCDAAGWR